jgi:UDP-glucose 4-epimerase
MKLLVTGASGFIGSRLAQAAIARFGTANVLALSSRNIDGINTLTYDPTDFSITEPARLLDIEILLHAGAFIPKSSAEANDIHGCNSNIRFSEKLLSHRFPKLRTIIYLSTVDVYAPSELADEETPALPQTLYGFSKLYCERMIQQAAKNRDITCHILRIGHVYGPGEEKYQKFIPNVMRNILAGKPVELWGLGTELRSYIFIENVVTAVLNAIPLEDSVGIINIVSGNAHSIKDLLAKIIEISGEQVDIICRDFIGVSRDCVFDNRKCRTLLLPSETDLITGLAAEFEHFKSLS